MKSLAKPLMLVVFLPLLLASAMAQISRGTISGIVTDSAGAVITGAKVELTNKNTGVTLTTTTNSAGIYRFDAVDLGVHTLRINQTGFKQFVNTDIGVEANRTVTVDATLEVGVGEMVVEVSAAADELLIKDSPIRGGNINAAVISTLPVAGLEPISIARTLPGVVQATGSSTFGNGGQNTQFSVNGIRARSNNYLLDGAENNDISVGGNAQGFNITDAVQEVSVQTSNFSSEFGRGGGGVFNVIIKGGTNEYHGTALWQYRSQAFNSVSNTDVRNVSEKDVFTQNIYGFTLGGPIIKNKTFAFGGLQKDTRRETGNFSFDLPTAATVDSLRALFPGNPRLAFYLNEIGDLRGAASPEPIDLGADPVTGVDRGIVNFGSEDVSLSQASDAINWLARIDHNLSEAHRLSFRYLYDSSKDSPSNIAFPGYIQDFKGRSQNFLATDTYALSPTWTNEFRFSYGRIGFDFPISDRSIDRAFTQFLVNVPNVSMPGIATNIPQFRYANNWLLQDAQTKTLGNHTFRYGAEFLWQLARQRPPFNERGSFTYRDGGSFTTVDGRSGAYSGFANFLDDFSGPSGNTNRNFGEPVYYPGLFRHSYFFQDTWRVSPSLSLTLGLRYENFGQPANNAFDFPAFAGFDPAQFLIPNKVNPDNNNFGPSVGFAWTPSFKSGLLGRLFGDGKSVWRGGFQISYDTFFNNLLSNIAADTPNSIATTFNAPNSGRGTSGFFSRLPATARPVAITDQQTAVFDKNIRSPYTERWSLGLQRELPSKLKLDISYVGTAGHKLYTSSDVNPRLPSGQRLNPAFGIRRIRASEGNSIYHALQLLVDRRFSQGFQMTGAYTFSRAIDSTSEVFGTNANPVANTSMPTLMGGLALDRALADHHRAHRFTITYVWNLPGPTKGFLSYPLGGWTLSGITTFQSGAPFSILNGFDRNNDALNNDRPDIGNPNAPINTRAVIDSECATGFRNPDALTRACVTPNDVRWIEGRGLPNGATAGRNTLFSGWVNNFDVNILKSFRITESKRLEYRLEAFNFFNHPQFTAIPGANVVSTLGPSTLGLPSQFLNPDFTNSGTRTMRMQLKFIF
jgi:hypothetical protein